jgi:hypothetical protein
MVQITELSPLAQASFAISHASENKWLYNHQIQSQNWLSNVKPQEHRTATLSHASLRFEELQDTPQLLCHEGISLRRGQRLDMHTHMYMHNPLPYNDVALPQCQK